MPRPYGRGIFIQKLFDGDLFAAFGQLHIPLGDANAKHTAFIGALHFIRALSLIHIYLMFNSWTGPGIERRADHPGSLSSCPHGQQKRTLGNQRPFLYGILFHIIEGGMIPFLFSSGIQLIGVFQHQIHCDLLAISDKAHLDGVAHLALILGIIQFGKGGHFLSLIHIYRLYGYRYVPLCGHRPGV